MYAIQNIKTGKFVYGTDRRYPKPGKKYNQRTSKDQMLTYADYYEAAGDFRHRGGGCVEQDGTWHKEASFGSGCCPGGASGWIFCRAGRRCLPG